MFGIVGREGLGHRKALAIVQEASLCTGQEELVDQSKWIVLREGRVKKCVSYPVTAWGVVSLSPEKR